MKRAALVLSTAMLVGVLAGCADRVSSAPGDETPVSGATPNSSSISTPSVGATPFVQTAEWAGEGKQITEAKTSAQAGPADVASALPHGYGTWAAQTDPIDITEDGLATLTATVPATVSVGGDGGGLGSVFPPDSDFRLQIQRFDEVKLSDATAQIRLYVIVSDFQAPYKGFAAWLY